MPLFWYELPQPERSASRTWLLCDSSPRADKFEPAAGLGGVLISATASTSRLSLAALKVCQKPQHLTAVALAWLLQHPTAADVRCFANGLLKAI